MEKKKPSTLSAKRKGTRKEPRERKRAFAVQITKTLLEEANPSSFERVIEQTDVFLAGWDKKVPELQEWKSAEKLVRVRKNKDYKDYLEMHKKYKGMLPREERVALGSAERIREMAGKTTTGARQLSPPLQFGSNVYTLNDLTGNKRKEGEKENSLLVKTDGGYWDIRFIPS
jgi:hypothetical protein